MRLFLPCALATLSLAGLVGPARADRFHQNVVKSLGQYERHFGASRTALARPTATWAGGLTPLEKTIFNRAGGALKAARAGLISKDPRRTNQ